MPACRGVATSPERPRAREAERRVHVVSARRRGAVARSDREALLAEKYDYWYR